MNINPKHFCPDIDGSETDLLIVEHNTFFIPPPRDVDPHSLYTDPDPNPDPTVFLNADPNPGPGLV